MQIQKNQTSNRIKISCRNCGEEFYAPNYRENTAKFCSQSCYQKYYIGKTRKRKRIKKICEICGKEFEISPGREKSSIVKYCSKECFGKGTRGKLSPHWKGGMLKILCQVCKKEFKVYPHRKNAKFCSAECLNKSRRGKISLRKGLTYEEEFGIEKAKKIKEKLSDSHKGKLAWNDLGFKLKCKVCEKEFKSAPSAKRIFCSKECMDNFQRNNKEYRKRSAERMKKIRPTINMKGKNNPMYGKTGELAPRWLDGKSFEPYNKSFNNKFRRFIRKRDSQVCMLCEIHREKLIQALDVHHINYDKLLSIPQNCISLCRKCHMSTNKDREIWTKHFQSLLSKKYGYQYSETGEIILEAKNEN